MGPPRTVSTVIRFLTLEPTKKIREKYRNSSKIPENHEKIPNYAVFSTFSADFRYFLAKNQKNDVFSAFFWVFWPIFAQHKSCKTLLQLFKPAQRVGKPPEDAKDGPLGHPIYILTPAPSTICILNSHTICILSPPHNLYFDTPTICILPLLHLNPPPPQFVFW